jgi:hypothetical protein
VADYDPPFSWDHIIPPKKSSTKDTLWEVRWGPDVWTCELVLDDYGSEARISKNGDLLVTRCFDLGWQTLAWAEGTTKNRDGRMFTYGELTEVRKATRKLQALATATGTIAGTIGECRPTGPLIRVRKSRRMSRLSW